MGADVCRALAYANPAEAVRTHVSAEDKQSVSLGLRGSPPTMLNESGLYALVMASRQKHARVFQRWVTKEVLPVIRKTGGYMTPQIAEQAITDPAVFMAKALVMAHESLKASA
ncbi:Bro-N domain-containing protein [Xylophilus sp. GOD-11R]|uniref:BRO-N domain-containing protein n=1 Tax=Xylophilus sp. GOD-11R TaxID=3089814 RepID=UPI00298BE07E|nr:BRO family protein [Xylophilus sp. GOD-11R]WPB58727.1 BRO family protein [Xylophilus sp. GOD-11R]